MKELKLYECEYCKTRYEDKEKCKKCEDNHVVPAKIKDKKYQPYDSNKTGAPNEILLVFVEGSEVWYRRKGAGGLGD